MFNSKIFMKDGQAYGAGHLRALFKEDLARMVESYRTLDPKYEEFYGLHEFLSDYKEFLAFVFGSENAADHIAKALLSAMAHHAQALQVSYDPDATQEDGAIAHDITQCNERFFNAVGQSFSLYEFNEHIRPSKQTTG